MLGFSSKTKVNKPFKVNDLLKMLQADKPLKESAKIIRSITLSNVLNKETMNLIEVGNVKEIYIFQVALTDKQIPKEFIAAFDKFIQLHTLFVLEYDGEYACYGALKNNGEKGMKVGKYYGTEWDKQLPEMQLPLSIGSLDDIYTAIVDMLIPIEANSGENVEDFLVRYEKILQLKKAIEKMQKQVANERQPNLKMELNDKLKALKKELQILEG